MVMVEEKGCEKNNNAKMKRREIRRIQIWEILFVVFGNEAERIIPPAVVAYVVTVILLLLIVTLLMVRHDQTYLVGVHLQSLLPKPIFLDFHTVHIFNQIKSSLALHHAYLVGSDQPFYFSIIFIFNYYISLPQILLFI